MTDQIVITEKSSQAKDARAAVGSRFGDILPAEGHLIDLLEPEDVVPKSTNSSLKARRPRLLALIQRVNSPIERQNSLLAGNLSGRTVRVGLAAPPIFAGPRRERRWRVPR